VVAERHRAGLVIVNGQDSPFSPGDIRAGDVDSRGPGRRAGGHRQRRSSWPRRWPGTWPAWVWPSTAALQSGAASCTWG